MRSSGAETLKGLWEVVLTRRSGSASRLEELSLVNESAWQGMERLRESGDAAMQGQGDCLGHLAYHGILELLEDLLGGRRLGVMSG